MLAVMMSGGGARAAYQVGVLRAIARRHPALSVPILTGVSAGAINSAILASYRGSFQDRVEKLVGLWSELTTADVFTVDSSWLGVNIIRWGLRLISGGPAKAPRVKGLVDTAPLRALLQRILDAPDGRLTGIDHNLATGTLHAIAITASHYASGASITWVHGAVPPPPDHPGTITRHARLHVDHVMASAALPLFFPAICVGDLWFGDGGICLTHPLSPARRLGATRILAVSTRSTIPEPQADTRYPTPAQIGSTLLNAIFLDAFDADAQRMQQVNRLIESLPEKCRLGCRHIDLLVMRPSQNLGRIAAEFEPRLPKGLRFMSRGLGARETRNLDFLSLLMFQGDYLQRVIELGERDAEVRAAEIEAFLGDGAPAEQAG
jgi:NTE family protein